MKGVYLLAGFIVQALCASSMHLERIPATPCNSTVCKLPDCYCSGTGIPGGLVPSVTPQFVLLNFDDGITSANINYYREALRNRKNPNNCSISATFFVSHEYTDYSLVHELNAEGHEISLHSMSHLSNLSYWANADMKTLKQEFVDQRTLTAKFANMTEIEIKGIRLPFLPETDNTYFQMMVENNFLYDASWYTSNQFWPFTLEYISHRHCNVSKCLTDSFPNLWTVPIINWKDLNGNSCAMLDGCVNIPDTVNGILDWMKSEFNRQHTGNKAPISLHIHATWFTANENRFEAFKRFLNILGTYNDVFIVKPSQVIDWVKAPKTISQMLTSPIICPKLSFMNCMAKTCRLIKEGKEERYMTACLTECPNSYPWLGNPLGEK